MNEEEQLTTMFASMGAAEPQARVMARQLLKRAEQIASERKVDRLVALAELLELVRAGRAGETYEKPLAERDGDAQ